MSVARYTERMMLDLKVFGETTVIINDWSDQRTKGLARTRIANAAARIGRKVTTAGHPCRLHRPCLHGTIIGTLKEEQ